MSTAQACWDFLQSEQFASYVNEFAWQYAAACEKCGLQLSSENKVNWLTDRAAWPLDFLVLGKFCQTLWEFLPDDPSIRHGAFFKLCDFAEQYVFG